MLVKESNEWLQKFNSMLSKRIKSITGRQIHYSHIREPKGSLLETIISGIVVYFLGQRWYEKPFKEELSQIESRGQELIKKIGESKI